MLKSFISAKHSFKPCALYFNRCNAHQLAQECEETKYPPIIDSSHSGKHRHLRQQWYDLIKSHPTIEQKLYEVVSKHDYFSRVYRMSACPVTYSAIPFQNYVTRTHLIQGLPEKLQSANVDVVYDKLKSSLCDMIENGMTNAWREKLFTDVFEFRSEKDSGNRIIYNLLSLCCRTLASEHPHLLEAAFDYKPTVSSYWYHGGFKALKDFALPEDIFDLKPASTWERETILLKKQLALETLCFQFEDYPYFTIRVKEPLPPVLPMDDALCSTGEVVDYNYLPRVFGIPYSSKYYIKCVPGTWPDEHCEFPFLQVYTSDKMSKLLSTLQHHSLQDIENGLGVMASFAWLNGLATYQGFSPYHDLTYPIVGQTIITNGQEWSFYVYQLNTIAFHADIDTKDRRNLCWYSGKMNLFETVENGQLKGLNDDVLKTILKFMVHTPKVTDGLSLKPYLGNETRTEEEIKTCHDELRKLYGNAAHPRAHLYEVPMWQHVYKRHPSAPPSPTIRLK